MSLGEKIKQVRKYEKLTQGELAEKLGIKTSTICDYEKNRIAPSLSIFKQICELFNLSADELLDLK